MTGAATLYLTCGVQCAGKTTVARRIERERGALRLSADEWLHELFETGRLPVGEAEREAVERLQWSVALRTLALGCDVVVDWGVWGREERARLREQARAAGAARVVLCFADVPEAELRRRLAARNADLPPGTYLVAESYLDEALAVFEPPTAEELAEFDADNAGAGAGAGSGAGFADSAAGPDGGVRTGPIR